MKKIAFLLLLLFACKKESIELPAASAIQAMEMLISAGKWQIKTASINGIPVIQDGKSIAPEAGFTGEIDFILFHEDGKVELRFKGEANPLFMQYEVLKEGTGLRIFQVSTQVDFLKKESWLIASGSVYSDRFSMTHTENANGITLNYKVDLVKMV